MGVDEANSLVWPVVIGGVMWFCIVMMVVYTNIWGYMEPISTVFRGKFHVPYIVIGAVMIVPLLWRWSSDEAESPSSDKSVMDKVVTITAAVLVFVAVSSAMPTKPSTPEPGENRLTILTYNIQLGSEPEGDRVMRGQLEFMRAVDADIIGLQESDSPRPGGGNMDLARYYADGLGYHMYFGPSTISGTFGTAILSRFPLENPRTIFSFSNKDETGTAVAEIEVNGTRIALFNSHPAGPDPNKPIHSRTLVEAASEYDYVIAVGDYNSRPGEEAYEIVDAALVNAWGHLYPGHIGPRHPTIANPSGEPADLDMTRRIDHVFLTPNFTVEEAWYVPPPDSVTDHPAHWATVTWE
jgi:endonuclease/exonuclease/phosphatase family metal-dependent hydrolase